MIFLNFIILWYLFPQYIFNILNVVCFKAFSGEKNQDPFITILMQDYEDQGANNSSYINKQDWL